MTIEYTLPNRRPSPVAARPPRIACLLSLAHRFDRLVRSGAVRDYAELAQLGHVTPARMTQIMNLLNLAPEIQEYLLWLPVDAAPKITERHLREIAAEVRWERQLDLFRALRPSL